LPAHPSLSLLDYELALVERQHAELGRFAFAEQDAFTNVADVELIMQRKPPDNAVLGKLVAESKYQSMPDAFRETGGDRDQMLNYIVREDRESAVRSMAAELAEHYGLSSKLVVSVFDFMINTTVDIEVDYLRLRLGVDANV